MTINIDSDYKIECDVNNFTLQLSREKEVIKKGIKKTVNETYSWYYPSLKSCLMRYIDAKIKDGEDCSISIGDVLVKLDEIHETIKNLKVK